MLTALTVIAILVFLIVVHELGHFIVAKLSGVKVEEFGIGYPPRAFTFGVFHGTEYTLNWIPFGGFVRLFGDSGEKEHGRGSLTDSPRWKQAGILVAGVAMNALAAWFLFTLAFHSGILQPVSADAIPSGEHTLLIVSEVVSGSPASAAGLRPGDEILGIADAHGERIIDAPTPDSIVAFVRTHAGEPLTVSYKSVGEERQTTITPSQGVLMQEAGQPALGVALVLVATVSEGWITAAQSGLSETLAAFKSVSLNLGAFFGGFFTGTADLSQVVGPVGIVSYVGAASQNGAGAVLMLAALISVNLAIINLLPIPALDGGRLVVLAIEAATRKSAPRLVVRLLNTAGIALIIFLMVTVTYHDIGRLLT
ncbi:site-2 protease family protein [Candidatus Kaiserbacteria bacterium]|nr:site-2 protease family protein [Candidatus Kaiserbacteria bacterium]